MSNSMANDERRAGHTWRTTGLKNVPSLTENISVATKGLFGVVFTVGSLINSMEARLAADGATRLVATIWAVAMMVSAVFLFEKVLGGNQNRSRSGFDG